VDPSTRVLMRTLWDVRCLWNSENFLCPDLIKICSETDSTVTQLPSYLKPDQPGERQFKSDPRHSQCPTQPNPPATVLLRKHPCVFRRGRYASTFPFADYPANLPRRLLPLWSTYPLSPAVRKERPYSVSQSSTGPGSGCGSPIMGTSAMPT
jgi:hypothetical protein